jgi:hypothetical protein
MFLDDLQNYVCQDDKTYGFIMGLVIMLILVFLWVYVMRTDTFVGEQTSAITKALTGLQLDQIAPTDTFVGDSKSMMTTELTNDQLSQIAPTEAMSNAAKDLLRYRMMSDPIMSPEMRESLEDKSEDPALIAQVIS